MNTALPDSILRLLDPEPLPEPWKPKDTAPKDGNFFIGLVVNPWEHLQVAPMVLQYYGLDEHGVIIWKPPLIDLRVSDHILAGWLELIQTIPPLSI